MHRCTIKLTEMQTKNEKQGVLLIDLIVYLINTAKNIRLYIMYVFRHVLYRERQRERER